jgi:hypothetical protein
MGPRTTLLLWGDLLAQSHCLFAAHAPAVYWREMPGNLLCRLWHATFKQPELLPHRPASECMATKACISWNRDAIVLGAKRMSAL